MVEHPMEMAPAEFEEAVRFLLEQYPEGVHNTTVCQGEKIGEYVCDIVVRFEALGFNFVAIGECKRHKNPVKRNVVQVLHDKIRELGAHKGIVFSTGGFQRGAIEYATKHGIALVEVMEGRFTLKAKSMQTGGEVPKPPAWLNIPPFVAYVVWAEGDSTRFADLAFVGLSGLLRELDQKHRET